MCWVMAPASPATTWVWRIASCSEVLPWCTCPRKVTTGGRSTSTSGTAGLAFGAGAGAGAEVGFAARLSSSFAPKRAATFTALPSLTG